MESILIKKHPAPPPPPTNSGDINSSSVLQEQMWFFAICGSWSSDNYLQLHYPLNINSLLLCPCIYFQMSLCYICFHGFRLLQQICNRRSCTSVRVWNWNMILIKHHILTFIVWVLCIRKPCIRISAWRPDTQFRLPWIYLKISHGCFLPRHPQFIIQYLSYHSLSKQFPYIHVHTARESFVVCHISLPWFPFRMVTRLCHQITFATLTIGQIYWVALSHPGVRG
jgi:hypothetical protein